MEGQELYTEYCVQAAEVPAKVRKHEALPAWAFVEDEIQQLWNRLAEQLEWTEE